MFYELMVGIFTAEQDELDDVLNKLEDLKEKMHVINPGQENVEPSQIDVLENHHDEHPHEPCVLISHWDNKPQ